MRFREFTDKIEEEVRNSLGEGYHTEVIDTLKNNSVRLKGLSIRKEGSTIAPTIYLEDYYASFCDGTSMGAVVDEIIEVYRRNSSPRGIDVEGFGDFERVKGRIVYKLVNRERNRERLESSPHRGFLDLAVIYAVSLGGTDYGYASVVINKSQMESWGVTEDVLWEYASVNTPRLFEPEQVGITEELENMMGDAFSDYADEEIRMLSEVYILTNKERLNGATCLLYGGIIKEITEKTGKELYIIPSSIHETLLLPKEGACLERLREMVREVNDTHVGEEDRLSYSIYETEGGSISIAGFIADNMHDDKYEMARLEAAG